MDSVYAIAFSPDGRQLVSASDGGTVRLWDTGTGAAIRTLEGHWSSNQAVAFSSDGKVLVSALGDGAVRLWDAGTRVVMQTLEANANYAIVQNVSFSDDGTYLKADKGVLYTTSLSNNADPSQRNLSCGIFVKEQWVTLEMENMLWLPPKYRPTCATVHGSVIALGMRPVACQSWNSLLRFP